MIRRRWFPYVFTLLPLVLLFAVTSQPRPLEAAKSARDFIGYWYVTEPTGDTFYIILKAQGRASGFYSGEGSNQIIKGAYAMQGNRLVITWPNGYRDVFTEVEGEVLKYSYPPESTLEDDVAPPLRANRINRNTVGDLAIEEPTAPLKTYIATASEAVSPMLFRNEFLGFWEITDTRRDTFFLYLKRGGKASIASRDRKRAPESEDGYWSLAADEARISWDSGLKDLIRKHADGYLYLAFDDEGTFRDQPEFSSPAVRVDAARAQGLFGSADGLGLTMDTVLGYWQIKSAGRKSAYVEINRWGRAKRIVYEKRKQIKEEEGRWELLKNGVALTWPEGQQNVIRMGAEGLEMASFASGNLLTAIPTRTESVDKVEASAFDQFLELARSEVTAESTRLQGVEEVRLAAIEAARQSAAEEARRKAEEKGRLLAEAEAHRRAEVEARQLALAEARRRAEEEARRRAQGEARRLAATKEEKRAAEEARRRSDELARATARKDAKRRREAEAERVRARREARLLAREQAHLEEERERQRKAKEVARRKAEEEAKRRAEALEEAKRKAAEEARRQVEEEARRKARALAEAQRRTELEAQRRADEESRRRAQALQEARRETEKARQRAEMEAKLRAQEGQRRKLAEEAKRNAEEVARRQAQALAEANRRADEEARKRAELETMQAAEADARRRAREARQLAAEQEARRKSKEEAELRAQQEALRRAELDRQRESEERIQARATEEARRQTTATDTTSTSGSRLRGLAAPSDASNLPQSTSRHQTTATVEGTERFSRRQASASVVSSPFVGFWQVNDADGKPYVVRLNSDFTARSTWSKGPNGFKGERGRWRDSEDMAQIDWYGAESNQIRNRKDGFTLEAYSQSARGTPLPISDAILLNARNVETWEVVFEDEFDHDELDRDKWMPGLPWTQIVNNELGGYSEDNVSILNGKLVLTAYDEVVTYGGKQLPYSTGAISSFGRHEQAYGFFEIRCRIPEGRGYWPAFWLISNSGQSEIDIMDVLGHEPDRMRFKLITRSEDGGSREQSSENKGIDTSRSFHNVGVMWTPDSLVYFVDGQEVSRFWQDIPHEPMYVVASLAVGGDGPGPPGGWTPFPGYFEIEYIRVFARNSPPGID